MTITFAGPAVFVSDMRASRDFYESLLGQRVASDHGTYVVYAGGFFLWQADNARQAMVDKIGSNPGRLGADNFELYFECPDLDSAWARVEAAALGPNRIVHPIEEQPWLQRGFRLRDPDGHLVEVGEPLPALVKRLLGQGMTLEDISTRTTIALEAVRAMAEGE